MSCSTFTNTILNFPIKPDTVVLSKPHFCHLSFHNLGLAICHLAPSRPRVHVAPKTDKGKIDVLCIRHSVVNSCTLQPPRPNDP